MKTIFNEFDCFDLASGLYHWLQHNWQSQSDPLYEAFCKLTADGMYKPSHSEEFFENIDSNAMQVYEMLTEKNYELALDKVLNYKSEE